MGGSTSGTAGTAMGGTDTGGGTSGSGTGATGGSAGDGGSGGTGGTPCGVNNGGCDLLTTCTDSGGTAVCGSCPSGYTGDGLSGCVAVQCTGEPGAQCPCIKVAPDGDDAAAVASHGLTPFANVQPAIDFAHTNRNVAVNVCVASGPSCGVMFSYPTLTATPLSMKTAIGVYGKYESSAWTRCADSTTTLAPDSGLGVVFGPEIDASTRLDGFSVEAAQAETSAAVTIAGARGAHLVNVRASNESVTLEELSLSAIDAFGGAELTLEASTLRAEGRNIAALGALASSVSVIDSVLQARGEGVVSALRLEASEGLVTGSTLTTTDWSGLTPNDTAAFRSIETTALVRDSLIEVTGRGVAAAARLEDSPGTVIEDSTITARDGGASADGVRVLGESTGVALLRNAILSQNATATSAITAENCAGSSVIIAGNSSIIGMNGSDATAIRVGGACNVRISSNTEIGSISTAAANSAIHCMAGGACTILDNAEIYAENSSLSLSDARGILCEGGGCAEISGNTVNGRRNLPPCIRSCPYRSQGIDIQGGSPFLSRNYVKGGCSDITHGVRITGANARLENNVIFGRTAECDTGILEATLTSFGLVGNTLDVHSNLIDGGGSETEFGCTSTGIQVQGTVRNNIIRSGVCETRSIGSISGTGSNNLSNCEFSVFPRLAPGSACINAGTPVGAPLLDLDGDARDALPDVGVDEWTCHENNGGCDPLTTCTLVSGAWACGECPSGYVGTGATGCVPDPCGGVTCSGLGVCLLSGVNGACACDDGFQNPAGNPLDCEDIDECAVGNGGCDPLAECWNELGGRSCGPCPSGYVGTGETGCVLDECSTNNGGCDPLTSCTNAPGGRVCGACPSGYTGTGETGCLELGCTSNPCQNGGTCTNLPGSTPNYQCSCPTGVNGSNCELVFTELAGVLTGMCGLRNDGKVMCWGESDLDNDPPLGTFETISTSMNQLCALDLLGAIHCFGSDQNGVKEPPSGAFTAVSVSVSGALGITSGGTISAWGTMATLGTIPSGTFLAVDAGSSFACGLRADQTLACWGASYANAHGQQNPPTGTFKAVASGQSASCALRTDDTVACWGAQSDGTSFSAPSGTFGVIDYQHDYGCGIRTDQTLSCWGTPPFGIAATPPSGTFKALGVGYYLPCAIRTNDQVACWGVFAPNFTIPTGQP